MKGTRSAWIERFEDLLKEAPDDDPDLLAMLYTPDSRLPGFLKKLKAYEAKQSPTSTERKAAGDLMEQVAFLTFRSLTDACEPESYKAVGSQVDLEVTGVKATWQVLLKVVGLKEGRHSFLLEAKATEGKVDVPVMTRLCALMNLRPTVGLGIFFTLKGCTGEPSKNEGKASLKDARYHQVLHYVRTGCPIIVFDLSDILALKVPGSLVMQIQQKIRDVEKVTVSAPESVGSYRQVKLPGHLAKLLGQSKKSGKRAARK